ncbi:hypothetical protein HRW07_14085 [Streptomyces lunaelactis]|uniref:hypothetical protein n=1 Tax=Streptomyces lunaelactis TaxID=1535768 RepID=UPI001584F023|nr:hypothetical protein [Streptomyces lunaelactis]NUL04336.1 hypothetical protein [Streptomyces lunaelactis]
MARKLIRARRLVVDEDTVYMWSVRHKHTPGAAGARDCRTTLSLRREGTTARLEIVFRQLPGRIISGGYWHSGAVGDTGQNSLNLHEPGAARRLLDEARERGLLPAAAGTTEVDGWPLFDAVATG